MATIMENKEKTATSGDEDVQIQDDTTPSVVQKPSIQTGTRKTISSSVDLGDLPSCRGLKKHKPNKTPLHKVPKFTPSTVDLDDPMVNVAPVQTIPPIQYENFPPPTKASRRAHPSKPSKRPSNLVLDKGYAWKTFKEIITDNEVNSCYNFSARDFERSAIHDLLRYITFIHLCFIFFKFK